ncbi:MAG TPA: M64 family metallopeptidase, partial [Candidatus Acidoferrum sp.]|nr:M64 family metallopeptidase [Candidatus Acidoferrum sp.]
MRRRACGFALILSLVLFSVARAQTIQTLVSNGPTSERINLTFFSEGYTAAELPTFITNVTSVLGTFFSTPPYRDYSNCFNVHAVSVASMQSGADHYSPTTRLVNTYFNSTFDSFGVDRVLTIPPNNRDGAYANGQGKVDALVADLIPESDIEVVLVNDPQYGGSGGPRLVASMDPMSPEIVMHELGHTFAQLGDEYEDPYPYGNLEEPNTTRETERSLIKWNSWILPTTPVPTPDVPSNYVAVGLFEGAHYHATGWYRPQHNCKMRTLNAPFCAVCIETAVLSIYRLVRPIDSFSPATSIVMLTNAQMFRVTPLKQGAAYSYQWFTNGVAVPSSDRTNLALSPQTLGPGMHAVRVEVRDPTPFVRNDPQRLLFDTNWWAVNVTSALVITEQPQSLAVLADASASFSVTATGAPPISYQWRFNGGLLDAQTNALFTISNVTPEHVGNYDVLVANDLARRISAVVTLTIETPTMPVIVQSPASQAIYAGGTVTFQVSATGTMPLTFFWSKDSVLIATNISPAFSITNAQTEDAGTYSVVVSNLAGVAASAAATLSVLPVPPLSAGIYNGLFFNSNDIQQASSGFFSATVRESRDFTARVQIGKTKQSFAGRFESDGRATNMVVLSGVPLEVRLSSDPDAPGALRGEVTDGTWVSELLTQRVSFHARTNPATEFAGRYTMLFPGATDGSFAPAGSGFAAVRINNGGVATFTLKLGDGTRVVTRASVVGSNELAFYAPLYAGGGAVFGWLRLKPESYIDLGGTAFWIRPPGSVPKLYPDGFTLTMPVSGSAYAPSSGTLFDIVLGRVILDGGNLAEARSNHVTLGVAGRITSAGPDKLQLKVTPATGVFKGSLTPAGAKP